MLRERDEAEDRLRRVQSDPRIERQFVRRAEEALADAEQRLARLSERVLFEDEVYRLADADLRRDQEQLDRIWADLRADLDLDPAFRRARDDLARAAGQLASVERTVVDQERQVTAIARELQRADSVYVSYVDVEQLRCSLDEAQRRLNGVNAQWEGARVHQARASDDVTYARRAYQQILAEYNRACAVDRGYRYGRP
jgi:hypothetical protein